MTPKCAPTCTALWETALSPLPAWRRWRCHGHGRAGPVAGRARSRRRSTLGILPLTQVLATSCARRLSPMACHILIVEYVGTGSLVLNMADLERPAGTRPRRLWSPPPSRSPSSPSGAAPPSFSAISPRPCSTPAASPNRPSASRRPGSSSAVMLFSFAVRSIYMESCGMFVRGGVYVVVRDSMGPFMAKLSVSALVVDYILTGPISSVSAGQYLGRLMNEMQRDGPLRLPRRPQQLRRRSSASSSPSTSGGRTSRAFTNPAARRCASCRSPPSWW